MTNILFVTSSPRGDASHSSKVAERVLTDLVAHSPNATVVRRDLARDPLPHINEAYLGAVFTPAEARNDEQKAIAALSDKLIDELFAADIIVIASSMINFSISSTLKTWVDYVARAGRTFSYVDGKPVGLVTGKRLVLVESKGGVYSEGPANQFDFQLPYLRAVFSFLGLSDIEAITVEGVAFGPEHAAKAVAAAEAKASETARTLAA
ncbi:FMN-dependent NADH-azoreductase [Kaistia sp. 32K]|uniref:FMN-dependent NADH-azoreductase n=1 Tax=Kaistia sp. 32K TaxID=2795690 RepID=UPI0019167A79|nr:FMN-dependent NADH-azoreductase [Kaistia sp. 32K]BCP53039.1 FMN-dependent NADH-azoreductase [Kaistia sp. 32K]